MESAGQFQRGEYVIFRYLVYVGDVGIVTELPTAHLKPHPVGTYEMPGEDVASVATFSVAVALEDDFPAGWSITLSDVQTRGLPAGRYITDLRFVPAGGVQYTEPLSFTLVETVTAP